MAVALGALTVVVVLLAVLVLGLLRSQAEIVRALHDAGVDLSPDGTGPSGARAVAGAGQAAIPGRSPAADTGGGIAGTDPQGDPLVVSLVGTGPTLVAFLTSSCLTCRAFWDAFADPGLDLPTGVRLVVVTKDAAEEQPAAIARLAPPAVPVVLSSAAWSALGVPVAPYFVLFGNDASVLGEGASATWPSVLNLLRQSLADEAQRAGLAPQPTVGEDDAVLRDAGVDAGHASLRPATDATDRP